MTTPTADRPRGALRLLPALALLLACRGPEPPGEVPIEPDVPSLPTRPPVPQGGPLPDAARAPATDATPAREDEGAR